MNGSVSYEGSTLLSGTINVNTGGNVEALNVQITENGSRTIEAPAGVDGYNPINIDTNVPEPVLDSIEITQNGTYTPPSGTDGYNEINVNVPQEQPNIQSLTTTIASNGVTTLHASDANCDGFDPVSIRVEVPEPVLISKTITENGTYLPGVDVDGYNEIVVDVPIFNYYCKNIELVSHTGQSLGDRTLSKPLEVGKKYLCIGYRENDTNKVYAGILNLTMFSNSYEIASNITIYVRNSTTISAQYVYNAGWSISIMDIPDGLDENPFAL